MRATGLLVYGWARCLHQGPILVGISAERSMLCIRRPRQAAIAAAIQPRLTFHGPEEPAPVPIYVGVAGKHGHAIGGGEERLKAHVSIARQAAARQGPRRPSILRAVHGTVDAKEQGVPVPQRCK